jgi:type IV secretion system protein VirD4
LVEQEYVACGRNLNFFGYESVKNALSHSDFSAHELGKNGPVAVFLQFDETKLNALGPLLAFLSTAILSILIDTAKERKAVALFLDELGNMPPIPDLDKKLNTIRSRNIPLWMFFQSAEQIERQYGKGAKDIFFAACDLRLFFRLNDNETRDYLVKSVGTTQKMEYGYSKSAGKTTATKTWRDKNVIDAHELGRLQPGKAVCQYRGASAIVEATPHFKDFPEFKRK